MATEPTTAMTAEAQALHAVLDDAARILRDFLPGELRTLQRACGLLGALCIDVRRDPVHRSRARDSFAPRLTPASSD
jgi:hypothetical protein